MHKAHAKNGRSAIQGAIRKYGENSFSIEHIGSSWSYTDLCAMERSVILQENTIYPHGYNLTYGGEGTVGTKHTPEHIEKAAAKRRGRKASAETRAKQSVAATGRKKSPEEIAVNAAALRGRKLSPEHCAKMSARMLGTKRDPELVRVTASKNKGKKRTPEQREAMRARATIAVPKIVAKTTGQKRTPEQRAKMSASQKYVGLYRKNGAYCRQLFLIIG